MAARSGGLARLRSLDALRGIAALAIVVWHWQHFFIGGPDPQGSQPQHFPFYRELSVLYKSGWLAVDLFFCLSGFVFYWLYADKVRSKAVGPFQFAWLRFSRLYPLHCLTLVFCAVGLALFVRLTRTHFVYPWDDTYHFVLQLLLVSGWGFEHGPSFNTPAWSISVEVLLYALFFSLCRFLPRTVLVPLAIALLGHYFLFDRNEALGRGVQAFFMGGVALHAFRRLIDARWAAAGSSAICAGLWIAGLFYFAGRQSPLKLHFVSIVLFPSTVLTLALLESARVDVLRRVAFLGDWSYSLYMLHFPLQLTLAIVALVAGWPTSIFESPIVFIAFFAVLIIISGLSFRYIELPSRRWLRSLLVFGRLDAEVNGRS